jgi:hypothetical protein
MAAAQASWRGLGEKSEREDGGGFTTRDTVTAETKSL